MGTKAGIETPSGTLELKRLRFVRGNPDPSVATGAVPEGYRVFPLEDLAAGSGLLLEESGNRTRVGGFVKVRITTDQHHDALAIPKIALVEDGALRSVFVAEADTVRKVEIETGLYDESHVEILEGLFEGDFVVTMGQGGLRTGSHIEALNGEAVGYSQAPVEATDPAADSGDLTAMAKSE